MNLMTGSSIESAMKSLYHCGRSVRRSSWEPGREVRFPDFRLNAPVDVLPNKTERIFVPGIKDILVMDWKYSDGGVIDNVDTSNGIYRAFMYALESYNPIAILGWYPSTHVYIDDGVIQIRYVSDGVYMCDNYIAQRDDYLSDKWIPYKDVDVNEF